MFSLVGSRNLSFDYADDVVDILRHCGRVSVGCCSGADFFVLSAALSGIVPVSHVSCFAAFSSSGAGSCRVSAVSAVRAFASAGGRVSWLAGGSLSIPIAARLSMRTRAVVSAGSSGCVAFLSSPSSVGSVAALRFAVSLGFPALAVPCGFPASDLPLLGVGSWVVSPVLSGAFVWSPDLGGLF